MIFAEIGPIQKTVNSYKNHEFIPPHGETKTQKPKTAFRAYSFCRNPQELWGDKEITISKIGGSYMYPF